MGFPTHRPRRVRRNPMLTLARRAFDFVVIGAVLYAAVETVVFLRGMVG